MNNILLGNIRGLYSQANLTKPSILMDLAKHKEAFLIALTETHLSDNISSSEITREGWDISNTTDGMEQLYLMTYYTK